jgi:hypothetical protein
LNGPARLLLLLLLVVLGLAPARGQPAVAPDPAREPAQDIPPRTLRLLPIGEAPPFRQQVRDGVRYELEPPPHSIPPRQVHWFTGKDQATATRLALGQTTAPLAIPAGTGSLAILAGEPPASPPPEGSPPPVPWLALKLPETGNLLAVLWRGGEDWRRPAVMLLPDELAAHPPGSVRVANTSPVEIRCAFQGKSITVPPRRAANLELGETAAMPVQISARDAGGGWKPVFTSALTQNPDERGLVVVFRADGLRPRQPLRTLLFRERTAPIPPPPPAP